MHHERILCSIERGQIYLHFGVTITFLSYVRAELFNVENGFILICSFRGTTFYKPLNVAKISQTDSSFDVDAFKKKNC